VNLASIDLPTSDHLGPRRTHIVSGPVSSRNNGTWVVARLGAAMHYAVPRILHSVGILERFYTDFYSAGVWSKFFASVPNRWQNAAIERAAGRRAADLPPEFVRAYPTLGLLYYFRHRLAKDQAAKDLLYLEIGEKFGELVSRSGFGRAQGVYTFTTAALEILRAAKQKGLFGVLEQTIAPRAVQERLLADEHRRFRDWEPVGRQGPATAATVIRERAEWDVADIILCGSEFVRQGIVECGGSAEKCIVVPYGVDERFAQSVRRPHEGALRVLCVGEAGLRKGIGYFAEVARMLGHSAEFRWVGPVNLLPAARRIVEDHVQLTGAIPRNMVFPHYEWADVMFLPSICEGSATVTYEALMSGLPVITTPNAGSIVSDGINGYVVPARDTNAMAESIKRLNDDRALLSRMQEGAAKTAEAASLDSYRHRLLKALDLEVRAPLHG
jgi:glycosyltransferase involved in cell wall biosynthesis